MRHQKSGLQFGGHHKDLGSANENKNANKFVQMSSGGESKSSLANSSLGEEKKMCRIFTEFQ